MPIRGLTRREDVTPRFTRLGKLKKGEQRIEKGKTRLIDLDHFRFVGEGPDAEMIERVFSDAYGPEPRQIRVYLPYKTLDENWQTWMEEWGKSGLIHRCDGAYMVQWLNDDKSYTTDPEQLQRKPCPYAAGEKERTNDNPGCVQTGRLALIIPELLEAGFVGYVTLEIHSINDLANITASIMDAEGKAQAAMRANGLQGIEFTLRRQQEQIGVRYQARNGDTIKTQAAKWMIRLDPSREWALHQLETARQMALGAAAARPALTVDAEIVEAPAADLMPTEGGCAPTADEVEAEIVEAAIQDEAAEAMYPEAMEPAPEPTEAKPQRPYTPFVLHDLITLSVERRRKSGEALGPKLDNFKRAVVGNIESCFEQHADQARHLVVGYLLGSDDKASSKAWDDAETMALHRWMNATEQDGVWTVDSLACQEAHSVLAEAMACKGQMGLFGEADPERPF